MGDSRDIDAVGLIRALDDAERALRRGSRSSAIRRVNRATRSLTELPRPTRYVPVGAVAAALMIGVALGSVQSRPDSAPIAAISVAGSALRAADRLDDPVALREILRGVQETITSLTPRAATDRAVAMRLRELAQLEHQLLVRTDDVPADLVERSQTLLQQIDAVAPAPSTGARPVPTTGSSLP